MPARMSCRSHLRLAPESAALRPARKFRYEPTRFLINPDAARCRAGGAHGCPHPREKLAGAGLGTVSTTSR